MVKINEIYELQTTIAEWNNIVSKFQSDINAGKETVIDRVIAGEPVRCVITGYSWDSSKKPFQPTKQRIKVQVTEILKQDQSSGKENN
jgi:hypothetical protein